MKILNESSQVHIIFNEKNIEKKEKIFNVWDLDPECQPSQICSLFDN
jgi:hypothetical protein